MTHQAPPFSSWNWSRVEPADRLERGRLSLEHALTIAEASDEGAHLNVFMSWDRKHSSIVLGTA